MYDDDTVHTTLAVALSRHPHEPPDCERDQEASQDEDAYLLPFVHDGFTCCA